MESHFNFRPVTKENRQAVDLRQATVIQARVELWRKAEAAHGKERLEEMAREGWTASYGFDVEQDAMKGSATLTFHPPSPPVDLTVRL